MLAAMPCRLVLAVMLALPALQAAAEPAPRVTTDDRDYCNALALRIGAMPAGRAEPVRSMVVEGQRLCDNGHSRAGVAKLRRAMRIALPEVQGASLAPAAAAN
jgi:hypothetical protein